MMVDACDAVVHKGEHLQLFRGECLAQLAAGPLQGGGAHSGLIGEENLLLGLQ